jgi:hypothetical protein
MEYLLCLLSGQRKTLVARAIPKPRKGGGAGSKKGPTLSSEILWLSMGAAVSHIDFADSYRGSAFREASYFGLARFMSTNGQDGDGMRGIEVGIA